MKVGSVQAAASQREAELSSKLEDYAQKFNDRNVLNDKVAALEKELQLARDGNVNQVSHVIFYSNYIFFHGSKKC